MTEINLTKKEEKEMLLKALFGSPFFNILASVIATFVVGAVFTKLGGGVPINVTSTTTTTQKDRAFEVSGEGKVVVVPDQASVRLGVRETGSSIVVLQDRVNKVMQDLGDSLKDLGIEKEDIATSNYSYNPDYQDENGYVASAELEVKIRDLEQVGSVLDLTGRLGLERVGGLTFELSDKLKEKSLKEAREMAIDEAKDSADELAKLAGMELGKIIDVQESANHPQPYLMREMVVGKSEDVSVVPTPIETGSSEVVVKVTLSYETL